MKKNDLKKLKNKLLIYSLITSIGIGACAQNKITAKAQEIKNNITTEFYVNDKLESLINYYSNVFEIKKDIVYKELLKKTNNLQNYAWQNYNNIDGKNYKNMEQAICNFAFDIYYNYSDYGYESRDEILNSEKYNVTLSPEEMVAKYSYLYDNNKEASLSIVYAECGNKVDSYNYRVNNNPAGIAGNKVFPNKEVGMIYFAKMLDENYHCKKDSDESFLKSIAHIYCELPEHWLNLTLPNYSALSENYFAYEPHLKDEIDLSIYEDNENNYYYEKK